MNTKYATPELFGALALAQGEIENADKNAANPHFKSKYADLAEVLNTIRAVFPKHGLSLTQSTEFDGAKVSVVTLLGHKSGGYITGTASCVPAKTDAQGVGSATTYLRRYSAAGMAGIAQEDDDGNAAAHTGKPGAQAYDVSEWLEAIADAADKERLDKLAAELRAAKGIPPAALTTIRAAYASKLKAVPA